MVVTLSDEQLDAHGDRLKCAVAIVTGAGNGIGKATAIKLAHYGAKVVVADLNLTTAEGTVSEITSQGGDAIAITCNVTSFEEQRTMFEAALAKYGSINIVVANAGVTESLGFIPPTLVDGKPIQPNLTTLEVNFFGALCTVHLGRHYLLVGEKRGSRQLKSMVVLSSVSGYTGIVGGPQYGAAKAGLVGLVRSMYQDLATKGIRISAICPFFAATGIVTERLNALLAGLPLVPVSRIASSIIHATSEADVQTTGYTYVPLDHGPVHVLSQAEVLKPDVLAILSSKCKSLTDAAEPVVASPVSDGLERLAKISDDEVFSHVGRAKGAVVFITGSSELSKATGLKFAQHGSKIVFVDAHATGVEDVISTITGSGGQAIAVKADLSSFDEQHSAFQTAIQTFGSVDVVVAGDIPLDDFDVHVTDGKVAKPTLIGLRACVQGFLYTAYLSQVYLNIGHTTDSTKPKALIAVSNAAAWQSLPGTTLYAPAMLGRLGVVRGLALLFARGGIRTAVVSPDHDPNRHGRTADMIIAAALDPDIQTAGAGYFLREDGSVSQLPQQGLTGGVYQAVAERTSKVFGLKATSFGGS